MEDELGNMNLKLIKLEHNREHQIVEDVSASPGVRLPKISIPTFNGKVLGWKSYWEQFDAKIHSNPGLSDTEKLTYMYLQDALKDGSAKFVIER